ncbi:MAG: phosphate ABC transporter substrate-binding protein, partial [Synechococcaceae bacterium WBB_10_009]|nr:phosphate ABC transporter substrate-binding protein [Synechococcaceae bacterium WBB_10_009]
MLLLTAGWLGAACLGAMPLAGAALAQAGAGAEEIAIVGSSTVYPFSQEAIRQFQPRAG